MKKSESPKKQNLEAVSTGTTAADKPAAAFEDRLGRLEEISEQIRESDVPLEDAAKLFEEGMRLARGLEKDLSRIERKIEVLVNEPGESGEEPILELFPELNTGADE